MGTSDTFIVLATMLVMVLSLISFTYLLYAGLEWVIDKLGDLI